MSKSAQLIGELARYLYQIAAFLEGEISGDTETHELCLGAYEAQRNLVELIKALHDEEIERVNRALDKAFGKFSHNEVFGK